MILALPPFHRPHRDRFLRIAALLMIAFCHAIFSPACSAQTYIYSGPAAPAVVSAAPLNDQDLDQLTAPIALYPDPLLAQLLPASTYPLDIVAAEQWSRANPTATDSMIDAQPWDPSIKALLHYPTVIAMMASDISWTQRLGEAYVNQPADVMNSIQRLRAQAQAAGSLISTPQQQVVADDGAISIIPAQPDIIYVPQYDPAVCYVSHYNIGFSAGFGIGIWLDKDTDWHHHWINEGIHWDHDHWDHRFHPLPHPVGHTVVVEHRPEVHQWVRDPARPLVVHVDHPAVDEHRGYVPPHVEPAPPPHAFGDVDKPRVEVEHEEDRGRASLHEPAVVHPVPPPRVEAPHVEPPHVEPPHAAPVRAPEPAHQEAPHGGPPGHH